MDGTYPGVGSMQVDQTGGGSAINPGISAPVFDGSTFDQREPNSDRDRTTPTRPIADAARAPSRRKPRDEDVYLSPIADRERDKSPRRTQEAAVIKRPVPHPNARKESVSSSGASSSRATSRQVSTLR